MTHHVRTTAGLAALALAAVVSPACSPDSKDMIDTTLTPPATSTVAASSSESTSRALRALAGRRIYFAHQSVGGNLMSGVEEILKAHADAKLNIVETHDPAAVAGPAFIHFKAGRNEDPRSKNADFVRVLDTRPRPDGGIAMLKYCFLDVSLGSDVDAIFSDYRSMVADLKQRHPDLTLVHVTMPLVTDQTGLKASIKRVIGRPTTRDVNLKRGHFNALLRKEFAREPIFDLATLEATRADGTVDRSAIGGEEVLALAVENTNDGGHLNTTAERRLAGQLLNLLASVPAAGTR